MDFTSAFKNDTRRGKGIKKKPKLSSMAAESEPKENKVDDVNRDLEDDNLLLADDTQLVDIDIPRNLTITQE